MEDEQDVTVEIPQDDAALDAALNEEPAPEISADTEPEPTVTEPVGEPEPAPAEPSAEEKLKEQVKQQEEFIQRRNTEIGDLRKQLAALQEQAIRPQQDVNDRFFEDPQGAVREILSQRDVYQQAAQIQQEIQAKEFEVIVKQVVPDIDTLIDDIAELAAQDGVPKEVVQDFKRNPYATPPALIVAHAQRAKLLKEVKALKTEIETLKKKPDDMLKKIETVARGANTLTAASGKSGTQGADAANTHLLSDAQLDELLKS